MNKVFYRVLNSASNLSKAQLCLLAVIFASIGGYFFLQGHAAASPGCTTTVSSTSAAQSAVNSAAAGDTVCMTAGSYGSITFSGSHSANVNFEPDPSGDPNASGKVTFTGIYITGTYLTIHNFYLNGGVFLNYPANHIVVDHNNIDDPSGFGIGIDGGLGNSPASPQPGVHDVTINGNKIHDDCQTGTIPSCEADSIHISGWGNLTITANEIYNTIQNSTPNASHADVLQSYQAEDNGAGVGLNFNHNYIHDNNTEGFFIKDGAVSNVSFVDNLGLRNPSDAHPLDVYDITNFIVRNNTDWNSSLAVLEGGGSLNFDHNVWDDFENAGSGWSITKSNNIYGAQPFTSPFSSLSSGETVNPSPGFMNTATDDYRLSSNPNSLGIDWAPSQYTYGPTSSGGSTQSADLNNDSKVNILDLSILLSNYGNSNAVADINKDGTVNQNDLNILLSSYGT